MSGAPRITYYPGEDATPQAEAATLASIYRFVLDTAKQKAAAHAPGNGSNAGKEINERSGKPIIPE